MITVTKRFKFCYGHWLPEYKGKCNQLHGHNAVLEVEIGNEICSDTHMVVDFNDIKLDVNRIVIDELDHKCINSLLLMDIEEPTYVLMVEHPTAERMVQWIVGQLKKVYNMNLVRVRLYETDDSYCEWKS